ncbi:MAG TPA: hypothetical protein VGQ51_12560 [Puia sp.]|jgi:predicted lipid-binding transport protein (Tim44 family)|nr:hypothetical protein [Puia sp.]
MRKLATFLIIVLAAIVIASIYSVGHDQATYSISPEYYTKFKFIQFNLADSGAAQHMTQPRSAVVMVGVKATWWMGLYIGLIIAAFALMFRNADTMFASAMQALGIVLLIAIICGVIGGYYGRYVLAKRGVGWWVPDNVVHRADFITVGSIHNFSYLGGVIGLVIAIAYLFFKRARLRKRAAAAEAAAETSAETSAGTSSETAAEAEAED